MLSIVAPCYSKIRLVKENKPKNLKENYTTEYKVYAEKCFFDIDITTELYMYSSH